VRFFFSVATRFPQEVQQITLLIDLFHFAAELTPFNQLFAGF
jgi:hypothetical protein